MKSGYKRLPQFHPFHMVKASPYPLFTSGTIAAVLSSILVWFKLGMYWPLIISTICLVIILKGWFTRIITEGLAGHHTPVVMAGFKIGFGLFIISEAFFFMGFFWAYFDSAISPSIEGGMVWPPVGIKPVNPWGLPLLNTIILLSSGATVTWSHYNLVQNVKASNPLIMTISLGLLFTMIQWYEYYTACFTMSDGIYGSVFYVSTGFHGAHVIVGTIFLCVCLIRMMDMQFNSYHHVGFELAIWYWHFVDIVWVLLFVVMYWWGS